MRTALEKATATRLAQQLVGIDACKVNFKEPYSYTSGGNGPFYADLRVLQSWVEIRAEFVDAIVKKLRGCTPRIELIAGIKTGAIPISILIADRLGIPHVSINKVAKEGSGGVLIEGMSPRGKNCAVIEDTVNEGKSLERGIEALRSLHAHIVMCVAMLVYHPGRMEAHFKTRRIDFHSIVSLEEVFEALVKAKKLSSPQLGDLRAWHSHHSCISPRRVS